MHQYKRWVIFTAALFLVISAALVNGPQLYYMAAILLTLPWASYFLGMLALRDLEFSRETPSSGWEGEIATFFIVVRSRARMPRMFLRAQDHLPEWLRVVEPEPPFFNAAPHDATKIPYRVELLKRGAYKIEWMTVLSQDPLGIFAFARRIPVPSEILVYPVPQDIPDISLSGAERFGYRDLPIAATRGSGVDPDGVRDYVPGDPLRRMHWKSTARTGKLNVIEFEESRAINVVMVMDLQQGTNVGEGKETTLEYLVRAAASIAQTAIRQGASVRLVTGDTPDIADFAGRGSEHLYSVLTGLARVEAADPLPLSRRFVSRVGLLTPGTTLIVLTAALDEDLPGALAHYSATGTQIAVFYADQRTFDGRFTRPTPAAQRAFMEGLLMATAAPYIIRKSQDGLLRPEPVQNVQSFPEQYVPAE
jgi:uncharacterized protein (DUF58 family)